MTARPLTQLAGRLLWAAGWAGLVLTVASIAVIVLSYGDGGIVVLLLVLLFEVLIAAAAMTGAILSGRGLARDPWRNRLGAIVSGVVLSLLGGWFAWLAVAFGFSGSEDDFFGDIEASPALGATGVGLALMSLMAALATVLLVVGLFRERGPAPDMWPKPPGEPPGEAPVRRRQQVRGAPAIGVALIVLAVVQLLAISDTTLVVDDSEPTADQCGLARSVQMQSGLDDGGVRIPAFADAKVRGRAIITPGSPLAAIRFVEEPTLLTVLEVPRGDQRQRVLSGLSAYGDDDPDRFGIALSGIDGDEPDTYSFGFEARAGRGGVSVLRCGKQRLLAVSATVPVSSRGICQPPALRNRCTRLLNLQQAAEPKTTGAVIVNRNSKLAITRTDSNPITSGFTAGEVTDAFRNNGWTPIESPCDPDNATNGCFGLRPPVTLRFTRLRYAASVRIEETRTTTIISER